MKFSSPGKNMQIIKVYLTENRMRYHSFVKIKKSSRMNKSFFHLSNQMLSVKSIHDI